MKLKYAVVAVSIVLSIAASDAFSNEIAKNQCAACHGPDGNSINPEWPSLAGQHPQYTVQQLQAFKSGERENPNMSAMVTNLSADDVVAIADYYASQSPKIGSIESDSIAAGEKLYRGGDKDKGIPACMACHGPNGAGNPAANYPALRGQHAKYTTLQLEAYRSGERKTDAERKLMMQLIAARLSDDEISDVARYINALH
jgi:cytochrome c553